ncbi:MAG TPA: hypothetical protein VHE81_08985, partial [Lacipirellulaceae bacterium]|nr:hypothetical protein [Lacipirellulaceae bacterium]
QVPPLPDDMVQDMHTVTTEELGSGKTGTFAHGLYLVYRFSASRPSVFAGCYSWLEQNHPAEIEQAEGHADPPSPNPTLNTDLDPS